MGKQTCGIYGKFRVQRVDGKDAPGERHHNCRYFVLDLNHDPHAKPAMAAYADSCEAGYPALAADCRKEAGDAVTALAAAQARIAELEKERDEAISERDGWLHSSKDFSDGLAYYRGLVVQIGTLLGRASHIADDGSDMKEVLCAKVPELVASVISDRDTAIAHAAGLRDAIEDWKDNGEFNWGHPREAAIINALSATPASALDELKREVRADHLRSICQLIVDGDNIPPSDIADECREEWHATVQSVMIALRRRAKRFRAEAERLEATNA